MLASASFAYPTNSGPCTAELKIELDSSQHYLFSLLLQRVPCQGHHSCRSKPHPRKKISSANLPFHLSVFPPSAAPVSLRGEDKESPESWSL